MKARTVPISRSDTPRVVMQRIITVRFAELLQRSQALSSGGVKGLHDMRIACKRLRYALETFTTQLPFLSPAAQALRTMQDTLGELHDCDMLADAAVRSSADLLYARLLRDRTELLFSARTQWKNSFRSRGPFAKMISYAELGSK